MKKNTIKLCYQVSDYEHSGDLRWGERDIKSICPEAKILRSWEERDREREFDYEQEYGELDEHFYNGYIEFEIPLKYKNKFNEYEYWMVR